MSDAALVPMLFGARWQGAATLLLIATVGFVLLSPLLWLLVTSFEVNQLGQASSYGLDNWRAIFTGERLTRAILNTVSLSVVRQSISLIVGILIAWLIARTNLPGRSVLEVGFWVALFIPALPVTLAWVLLFGGGSGLANQLFRYLSLPEFNIYSWWGIIWVHLMTATIPVKVFLLVPTFRLLDSAYEEAARASGASLLRRFGRIIVPLVAPIVIIVLLIGLVRAMQAFEVELILGTPAGIDVYSTIIYRAMTQEPPLQGVASALSIAFLLSLLPFVIGQQWYSSRRVTATVSGRFSNRRQDLGRWRWPLFVLVALLLLFMTVLPICLLLMSTFMKLFGMFDMEQVWTTEHWADALSQGDTLRALINTLRLGVASAVVGTAIFMLIAYVSVRTSVVAGKILEFMTWLPTLIPGLVLSLGLLQMFTGFAVFRPFYGTIGVLVLAVLIGTATIGTQIMRSAILQVGRELEDAALASGGSRFYSFRRIFLPLLAPVVAVVGLEIFATANSAVGIVALLGTGANQPLSILQLVQLDSGKFEAGAVVGVVIMALTVASALLARVIASRMTLAEPAMN
jgi:iron(III) transport system permease protein